MTAQPSVHDLQSSPRARSRSPGFVFGLIVGVVVGFGAGVLVERKGCPPVPVPAATGANGAAGASASATGIVAGGAS